jgi:hypothetical protein
MDRMEETNKAYQAKNEAQIRDNQAKNEASFAELRDN